MLAAGRQKRLFDLMDLDDNQGGENGGRLSAGMVHSAGASVPGLDVPALLVAQESSAVEHESQRLDTLVQSEDVRERPTALAGKSGGPLRQVQLTSAGDPQPVRAAIESALR